MDNNLLTTAEVKAIDGNPLSNKDAILLVKQEDGNWRGFAWKHDKLVQCRVSDPNTALNVLITHE